MNMQPEVKCETCRWWVRDDSGKLIRRLFGKDKTGTCMFNPKEVKKWKWEYCSNHELVESRTAK